jgi:hypothetical protein
MIKVKVPFRCPVCSGKCVMPRTFYEQSLGDQYIHPKVLDTKCRTCKGKGVIFCKMSVQDNVNIDEEFVNNFVNKYENICDGLS